MELPFTERGEPGGGGRVREGMDKEFTCECVKFQVFGDTEMLHKQLDRQVYETCRFLLT